MASNKTFKASGKGKQSEKRVSLKSGLKPPRDLSNQAQKSLDDNNMHNKLWDEMNLIFKYPVSYLKSIKEYIFDKRDKQEGGSRKKSPRRESVQDIASFKEGVTFAARLLSYLFESKISVSCAILSLTLATYYHV